jgi:glutamine cyclotransferase
MNKALLLSLFLCVFFVACNSGDPASASDGNSPKSKTSVLSYSVAATFPHDTSSYTQGLEFYKGELLEGTGNYGHSKLMQLDLATGKPKREIALDSAFFGEGITVLNDTLYQLTYKEKKVFVYTAKDFKKIKEYPLNTEGWGMTNDGTNLIVTDGSNNLYFYEPGTFRLMRTQGVTEDASPTVNLNELEYINGFIYANQYSISSYIFKIDPSSGQVVAKLDLSDLTTRTKSKTPGADVINGIAYNPDTKKVYVTGKLWPELYEISFPF